MDFSPRLSFRFIAHLCAGIVVVIGRPGQASPPELPPPSTEVPADPEVAAAPSAVTTGALAANSDKTVKTDSAVSRWLGSAISLQHSATTLTFDKAADLHWNPTVYMTLTVAPRFAFDKVWSVSANFGGSFEYTQDDTSTYANEFVIQDTALALNAAKIATIPGVGIDVSAGLGIGLPTSKASRADTLLFSLSPSIRLSKSFDQVLSGLTLGYGLRFTKSFHRFTTGETESPQVPGCSAGGSVACDSLLSTGYRNSSFRLGNSFDVSLGFTDWLSLSASLALYVSWLYDDIDHDAVSFTPLDPTDQRFAMLGDVSLAANFWKPLVITAGFFALNPQLAQNGDRYAPFVNRFSTVYLDVRLDVAALIQTLTEEN